MQSHAAQTCLQQLWNLWCELSVFKRNHQKEITSAAVNFPHEDQKLKMCCSPCSCMSAGLQSEVKMTKTPRPEWRMVALTALCRGAAVLHNTLLALHRKRSTALIQTPFQNKMFLWTQKTTKKVQNVRRILNSTITKSESECVHLQLGEMQTEPFREPAVKNWWASFLNQKVWTSPKVKCSFRSFFSEIQQDALLSCIQEAEDDLKFIESAEL